MMRWTIVTTVIAAVAAALFGTYHFQPEGQGAVADELLAYEVTPSRGVTVDVPGGTPAVYLTSWAMLAPDGRLAELEEIPYALDAFLRPRGNEAPRVRRYATVSRVSALQPGEDGFGARLADGPEWLADPRTIRIDTSGLGRRGGQLRIMAAKGEHERVLLRLAYRFERDELARSLVERSLSPEEARDLMGGASALGFVDLSRRARATVLSFWARRLTAVGRVGVDYRTRRLLVGDTDARVGEGGLRALAFDIGPERHAVFNFAGPVRLGIRGPAGMRLRVHDGGALVHGVRARLAGDAPGARDAPRSVTLSPEGYARVMLARDDLRSVVLESDVEASLSFFLSRQDAERQLGDVDRVAYPDGRLQVGPDVRRHPYYRLAERKPVRYSVVPGQGPFRLQLRAIGSVPPTPEDQLGGVLEVRYVDAAGRTHRESLPVQAPASDFDDFEELQELEEGGAFDGEVVASDPAIAYLSPPPGVREVALYGEPGLLVSAAVEEPGVVSSERGVGYRIALDPDQRLVHVPMDVSRLARLDPDNAEALTFSGRRWMLRGQVRLVTGGLAEVARPERGILPLGAPTRRTLWVQRVMQEGSGSQHGDVAEEWYELQPDSRIRVPGPPGTRVPLRLRFEVDPQQLGQTLQVALDGEPVVQHPLMLTSGSLSLPVPAGRHQVAIDGLGDGGVLYADAPPQVAMEAVRAYSVFELRAGGHLRFSVPRRSAAPLLFVLFVATEGSGVPWRIEYTVDGGRGQRRSGVFYRERTDREGVLEGTSGDYETGLLWEAPRRGPRRVSEGTDGVSKVRLHLGDDLAIRRHAIDLRLAKSKAGPDRVWVRAVLVGQDAPRRAISGRQFSREVSDEL